PPRSPPFPYTTLFRSVITEDLDGGGREFFGEEHDGTRHGMYLPGWVGGFGNSRRWGRGTDCCAVRHSVAGVTIRDARGALVRSTVPPAALAPPPLASSPASSTLAADFAASLARLFAASRAVFIRASRFSSSRTRRWVALRRAVAEASSASAAARAASGVSSGSAADATGSRPSSARS